MIKHCLGISEINSIPEWRISYLTNAKVYGYNKRKQILFIQNREIKEIFDAEKLTLFHLLRA